MNKVWQDESWEDFEYWTKQDRKTLKRILQLVTLRYLVRKLNE
jgi:toxin YoeB